MNLVAAAEPLLAVEGVCVTIPTRRGEVYAVRDASFSVGREEKIAILGESGSGKSLTEQQLQQVASYLISQQGSNPARAKGADPSRASLCEAQTW